MTDLYTDIIDCANKIIDRYNRRGLFIAEEVVSIIYLQIFDKGLEFTLENFRKLMTNYIRFSSKNSVEISEGEAILYSKLHESNCSNIHKYCTDCKEPKTKDDFYNYLRKSGKNKGMYIEFTVCKSCIAKKSGEWNKKRLEKDPDYARKAGRKYVSSGRNMTYKRKGRLNLDNWYLVATAKIELKKTGMNKEQISQYIADNPLYLEEVKNKIIERRKVRKSNYERANQTSNT